MLIVTLWVAQHYSEGATDQQIARLAGSARYGRQVPDVKSKVNTDTGIGAVTTRAILSLRSGVMKC